MLFSRNVSVQHLFNFISLFFFKQTQLLTERSLTRAWGPVPRPGGPPRPAGSPVPPRGPDRPSEQTRHVQSGDTIAHHLNLIVPQPTLPTPKSVYNVLYVCCEPPFWGFCRCTRVTSQFYSKCKYFQDGKRTCATRVWKQGGILEKEAGCMQKFFFKKSFYIQPH